MCITFQEFGFYTVNELYLQFLNNTDKEVMYEPLKGYDRKPFVGILVLINSYNYFIPLTSAKPKHAKWKNRDKGHFLIYRTISKDRVKPAYITKPFSKDKDIQILASLELKKMIPVPEGQYVKKIFKEEADKKYKKLLMDEYAFCLSIKNDILEKAERLYKEQKESGKVMPLYCNFALLEKACDEYGKTEVSAE